MVQAVETYLQTHDQGRYSREEFDRYCHKEKLALNSPVIHITGSNGKGSTAHLLMEMYLSAGYHVGAFIKPSFHCLNECIFLDGKMISDEELASLFGKEEKAFAKYGLSAFEASVALAYRFFAAHKPDLLIIEAGMGGIIDATNIEGLPTILSIITSVSLEHTAYLGTTVSQIAYSKAGIIKPEVPVLLGKLDDAAKEPIRDYAEKLDSPLYEVDDYHFERLSPEGYTFDYRPYKGLQLKSLSFYQLRNAALAIEATKLLAERFPVSEEATREALTKPSLPGRFDIRGNVIYDGAHNPEAATKLVEALGKLRDPRPIHVLFASMRDKNINVILPTLNRDCVSITLTTFPHFRARTEEDYFLYLADYPFVEDPKAALDQLKSQYPDDLILVTGSLAFVGFLEDF